MLCASLQLCKLNQLNLCHLQIYMFVLQILSNFEEMVTCKSHAISAENKCSGLFPSHNVTVRIIK